MMGLLAGITLGQPFLTSFDISKCLLMRAMIGVPGDKIHKSIQCRLIATVPEIEMAHIKFMLSKVGETSLDMILGLKGIGIIRE